MNIKIISFVLMIFILTSCSSKTSTQTTGESSENAGEKIVHPATALQTTEAPSEPVKDTFHAAPETNTSTQTTGESLEKSGESRVRSDAVLQAAEAPSESIGGDFHITSETEASTKTTEVNPENIEDNIVRPDVTKQEKHDIIKISIIDIDGNNILQQTEVEFKEGQTVYDVLAAVTKANNIELKTRGSGAFTYIERIGSISEFDQGPLSGWIYLVNGEKPNKSAGAYKLKPKDEIIWKFTQDAK